MEERGEEKERERQREIHAIGPRHSFCKHPAAPLASVEHRQGQGHTSNSDELGQPRPHLRPEAVPVEVQQQLQLSPPVDQQLRLGSKHLDSHGPQGCRRGDLDQQVGDAA